MKKIIGLIILISVLQACDSPRTKRSILTSSNKNSLTNDDGTTLVRDDSESEVDDAEKATDSTIPADAKHCKFSKDGTSGFESTHAHIGQYTLCQSSTDKTVFYAQFKTPPVNSGGDVSICFIPHTTSGSNSIYVGNPMCGTFSDPKTFKKITFVKYSQYTNALINSVMFFKDGKYYYPLYATPVTTLDAYRDCLARLSFGSSTHCASFKTQSHYVLKSF